MRYEELERGQPNSPEAIKADIEQTRAQMSSKIDSIQDRLDPDRLKVQAQDAAKELIHEAQDSAKQVIQDAGHSLSEYMEGSVHSMSDYVQNNREEIGRTVVQTVKRNPLPTALIGLGVGWLLMSGMGNDEQKRNKRAGRRRRRFQEHDAWERNLLNQDERAGRIYTPGGDYDYDDRDFDGRDFDGYDRDDDMRFGQPGTEMLYRGREFAGRDDGSQHSRHDSGHDSNGIGERIQQMGQSAAHETREMGQGVKEDVLEKGQAVKDRVEKTGHDVAHRTQELGHDVGGRVQDTTQRIQATGEQVVHEAQEMGQEFYERAQDGIDHMREQVGQMGEQTSRRGNAMGRQLHRRGRRAGRQLHDGLEDNPLTFGVMAFATGAALAMLLPQTRAENRMIGEYRDEFVGQAREASQAAREHAQNVYEEVRPDLEEGVQRVASEMRAVGESAVEDVKQTAEKATDKAKSEAEATLHEVSDNQSGKQSGNRAERQTGDKSGGNQASKQQSSSKGQSAVNSDVIKGQWNQLKGEVKQKWGKLTDDDITQIEGSYDKLVGRIQERYGYARERAEQEANRFFEGRNA